MKPSGKKRKIWKILLIIAALIIIIRLLLPFIVLKYANKTLSELDDYSGHIDDVDIALIKGAYAINGLVIDKIDSATNEHVPFVSTDRIDIALEWNALFKGKIAGELAFMNPVIRFTREKLDPEDIQDDTTDFRKVLKGLMPMKINRFDVNNGQFQFIDSITKPAVNLTLDNIDIVALNLSSVDDTSSLPASINASANVYGGTLNLKMKLNPLTKYPTYDMNVELENTQLTEMNKFLKAYANIDVNKGTFGLYAEVAGKGKSFAGYVKPVIKDLDIVGPADRKDSFFNKVLEGIASIAGSILENNKKEQVATKIPITGKYDDPYISTWYAIVTILRNAFVQALYPSIDNQINLSDVKKVNKEDDKKSVLEKIFNESDSPEKEKDKDKRKEERREKRKERQKEESKEKEDKKEQEDKK